MSRSTRDALSLFLVAVCAVAAAVVAYVRFLADAESLWRADWLLHDRHAHYLCSLKMAVAFRTLDVPGFLGEFVNANVWPPLHSILSGLALAVFGLDYRVAVVPNVVAWAATSVVAFLLARRCAPAAGNVAGFLAAAFVLVSPSHHAYAVDVMLESLGGFLTLLTLWAYVRAVQVETPASYRLVGVCLTLMVVEKYNYWVLVVLALVVAEFASDGRGYIAHAWNVARNVPYRRIMLAELLHPLTFVFLAVAAVVAFIAARGPVPLDIAGKSLNVYPPGNLVQVAVAVLCLRLLLAARPWRPFLDSLGPRWSAMVAFHLVPTVAFFLLPRHLGAFLWYVSPANSGADTRINPLAGAQFYSAFAVAEYHTTFAAAVAVVGLFVVAILGTRVLNRGTLAVLALGVLGTVLTCVHPNHQGRYLHSWIPALWVGASLGCVVVAMVVSHIFSFAHDRLTASLAVTAVLAVVGVQTPAAFALRRSAAAGPNGGDPSFLAVTDDAFAHLDPANPAMLLSGVPARWAAQCAYLERHGTLAGLHTRWFGWAATDDADRAAFAADLARRGCDRVVVLETMSGTHPDFVVAEIGSHMRLGKWLADNPDFVREHRRDFADRNTRVSVYRKKSPS